VSALTGAPTGTLSVAGRLERLRPLLEDAGVDALLVTELTNVRYLCGFTGSAGMLLVHGDTALLVTDGRYRTQAAEQLSVAGAAGIEMAVGNAGQQRRALVGALEREATARLGLEADHVTWGSVRRFDELVGTVELLATTGLVEGLRQVKDDQELARMAYAAEVADAALAQVRPMLDEERTEHEVALALDTAMRRLGAEDRAFETIVASGPNAAKPHARPTGRRIRVGDPVVVDFGAAYEGYRSDMTRTFFVGGPPDGVMARALDAVASAQASGVSAVRAGVVGGEVDKVCRQVIADAGFGDAFEHGTGHGVGLDIHEAPSVGPGATAILRAGAVVTVEPGVYLAGVGGVRVEDTVVVTEHGCRPLTCFPKDRVA
jgi:Xaa-Pro aminopeptidase